MCGCLSGTPFWGPGPQPRHVPWLGIALVPLWFTARAQSTEPHQPGRQSQFLSSWICQYFYSLLFGFMSYFRRSSPYNGSSTMYWITHLSLLIRNFTFQFTEFLHIFGSIFILPILEFFLFFHHFICYLFIYYMLVLYHFNYCSLKMIC